MTLRDVHDDLVRERLLYLRARQLNLLKLLSGFTGSNPGPRESVKDFLTLIVHEKKQVDDLVEGLSKGEADISEKTFMEQLTEGRI